MPNHSEISGMEYPSPAGLSCRGKPYCEVRQITTLPLTYAERTSGHCIGTLSITETHFLNDHKNIKNLNIIMQTSILKSNTNITHILTSGNDQITILP